MRGTAGHRGVYQVRENRALEEGEEGKESAIKKQDKKDKFVTGSN